MTSNRNEGTPLHAGGSKMPATGNVYDEGDVIKVRRHLSPAGPGRWVVAAACLAVIGVLALSAVLLVGSVQRVKAHASEAMAHADDFVIAAKSGDADRLLQVAHSISSVAHNIEDELRRPVWELLSHIPVVGSDVKSVRTLGQVAVDLTDNAVMPLAHDATLLELDALVEDSTVSIPVLTDLIVSMQEVSPALSRSAEALKALPPAHLGPVADVLDPVSEAIISANDAVERIQPLVPYLPYLLGANGETREYLILAQNTAEIHAIGGFVGTFGILTITDGHIEMGEFKDLMQALSKIDNAAGATPEEIECFGIRSDTHHGDHNIIPDFSRVGLLYMNIWDYYQGFEVDGVMGFDPVFLQYLLESIGSIETSKGITVDSTNAAAVMLNQSLFWWAPKECDVFYRDVADEVMARLLGNLEDADMMALSRAVIRAASEDRCLMWLRDKGAEEAVKEAGFAGQLPHDPTTPQVGVYVSDSSTSKMSFYLGVDTELGEPRKNADGSSTYDLKVTFTNNFDPDARDTFPGYIKVEMSGRSECDLYEEVRLIAPEGGSIDNVQSTRVNTRGSTPKDSDWRLDMSYQGLEVEACDFRIDAQESVVVTCTVTTSPEATEPLSIRKTPVMPPEIAYWNQDILDAVQ